MRTCAVPRERRDGGSDQLDHVRSRKARVFLRQNEMVAASPPGRPRPTSGQIGGVVRLTLGLRWRALGTRLLMHDRNRAFVSAAEACPLGRRRSNWDIVSLGLSRRLVS